MEYLVVTEYGTIKGKEFNEIPLVSFIGKLEKNINKYKISKERVSIYSLEKRIKKNEYTTKVFACNEDNKYLIYYNKNEYLLTLDENSIYYHSAKRRLDRLSKISTNNNNYSKASYNHKYLQFLKKARNNYIIRGVKISALLGILSLSCLVSPYHIYKALELGSLLKAFLFATPLLVFAAFSDIIKKLDLNRTEYFENSREINSKIKEFNRLKKHSRKSKKETYPNYNEIQLDKNQIDNELYNEAFIIYISDIRTRINNINNNATRQVMNRDLRKILGEYQEKSQKREILIKLAYLEMELMRIEKNTFIYNGIPNQNEETSDYISIEEESRNNGKKRVLTLGNTNKNRE